MNKWKSETLLLKTGQEVVLRELLASDTEQYNHFSEAIAAETKQTLHYPGQYFNEQFLKEKWDQAVKSTDRLELGAFIDNQIIGHLNCYKPRGIHPYESHILEFGIRIRQEYCSCGLGTKMISIMESLSEKMGFSRVQAVVRVSNDQGIPFYLNRGYFIEGTKKHAVCIDGLYEDELYIAKIINPIKNLFTRSCE